MTAPKSSARLIGFVGRRRVAIAIVLAGLIASPVGAADDRQLLQASTGARTNVLVILDSSLSMSSDFTNRFRLPAYMDDFIYPEGTFDTDGSKLGVAKSVLRQVMTNAAGVNWAFAYYKNPNQTMGAAATDPTTGVATGGARAANVKLENGGLEWLYFADAAVSPAGPISSFFSVNEYPDIQQGRFLQLGHKVMHNYEREDTDEVADTRPPYNAAVGVPLGPPVEPFPGTWRGAFGPHGLNEGFVVYRNPSAPFRELHMKVVSGNYGDPEIFFDVEEWAVSFHGARFLAVDSEFIDGGLVGIKAISEAAPFCGNNNSARCVNDDIAGVGVRTKLFTRGDSSLNPTKDITPYNGLVLPTGQAADQGLFKFTSDDPQRSAQNGAEFSLNDLLYHQGNAQNDNNLDKVEGVVPLTATEIFEMEGKVYCAMVFKSDISDTGVIDGQPTSSLKGGTKGITAFRVADVQSNLPSLPLLTIDLLPSNEVTLACDEAVNPSPPPPPAPVGPECPGIPLAYGPPHCAPCPYDTLQKCAFIDANANSVADAGEGPAWGAPLPASNRGFDDPQADPDLNLQLNKTVRVRYRRGDLWNLPPNYVADEAFTGNPPWGSQPGDGDADSYADSVPDRNNRGMFASVFEIDKVLSNQQQPNDALGEASCTTVAPCDPYSVAGCGGLALNTAAAPPGFVPYPANPAPAPATWPVVPLPRDWIAGDAPSVPMIKRLLRQVSSLVSYDRTQPASQAYELEEDAKNVVMTAPGSPIAGALRDAYKYFLESVFQQTDDPAINCRDYKIVLVTDGLDSCGADPCVGGSTGQGPAGDLAELLLPESSPGLRQAANAADPRIRLQGIPVYVVALGLDPNDPKLTCLTKQNTNGQVIAANDRATLRRALESIFELKTKASFIAGLDLPTFASASGDTARVAAVIPSHVNNNDSDSEWSIWNGFLKAFNLVGGQIPSLTTLATGALQFPDETTPNSTVVPDRKPVWDAGRVLGYTDPVGNLAEKAAPVVPNAALSPTSKAPAIRVWPGRRIVWAGGSGVPLTRRDFLPTTTGSCPPICFDELMTNMGLTPTTDATKRTLAQQTVQYLRGGITAGSGSRDEVLNLVKPSSIGTIGPASNERQKFSFWYQDDTPAPGTAPQFRTDGEATPAGYPHKLGDIFHSEPFVLEPPRYFQYLSLNLNGYRTFAEKNAKRRKVAFVGANDGFLHAFDAGVWDRLSTAFPTDPFDRVHDVGTGREIFAYAPRGIMAGFPGLLNWPPTPQYFVDGSMSSGDVFIDPQHTGVPTAGQREWRSVLVGSLRQGGAHYFALDVTQPDDIVTNSASATYGEIVGNKDASPGCLTSGNTSCNGKKYPEVLWELTDDVIPKMGETWSRAVLGRIRVINASNTFEDRYVAIFGGGRDPMFSPGDTILAVDQTVPSFKAATRGRALYIVDVETGQILHKAVSGSDGGGGPVLFAPIPAPPATADFDDNGYLDVVYVGDVNGRMWKLSLEADIATSRGKLLPGEIQGFQPFLLYDASKGGAQVQPIFFEPGIVSLGKTRLPVGVAFGTGDRADLATPNVNPNRFHLVVDTGQAVTFDEDDLRNITPQGGVTPAGEGPGSDGEGYFLDFQTANEKTISKAFSTQGNLSVATFTPDAGTPCGTEGSSFRYSFFYNRGEQAYNLAAPTGTFADYRQSIGPGLASVSQAASPEADTVDSAILSGGAVDQQETPATIRTLPQNWKDP